MYIYTRDFHHCGPSRMYRTVMLVMHVILISKDNVESY